MITCISLLKFGAKSTSGNKSVSLLLLVVAPEIVPIVDTPAVATGVLVYDDLVFAGDDNSNDDGDNAPVPATAPGPGTGPGVNVNSDDDDGGVIERSTNASVSIKPPDVTDDPVADSNPWWL